MREAVGIHGESIWLLSVLCCVCAVAVSQEAVQLTLDDQKPPWIVGSVAAPRQLLRPSWLVGSVEPRLGERAPGNRLPPQNAAPAVKRPDGTVQVSDDDLEFEAHQAVKPMVTKLFTNIAAMNKVTGKLKPASTNTVTKLVDAALFSATNAHETQQKKDKERFAKNQVRQAKAKDEAKKESEMQSATAHTYRHNKMEKMRKDERSEMKNGVQATLDEEQILALAYKNAVVSKHRSREKWNKASEKLASTKVEWQRASAAQENALEQHKKVHARLKEQGPNVAAVSASEAHLAHQLVKEEQTLKDEQQAEERDEKALDADKRTASEVTDAKVRLEQAHKVMRAANTVLEQEKDKLDAIKIKQRKASAEQQEKLKEINQNQITLQQHLSRFKAEGAGTKGDAEISAKAKTAEARNRLRAVKEQYEKLSANMKAGQGNLDDQAEAKDIEDEIHKRETKAQTAQKAEEIAKEMLVREKKKLKAGDGSASALQQADSNLQSEKKRVAAAKSKNSKLQEHVDQVKFGAASLQKQADKLDTSLAKGKAKLRTLSALRASEGRAAADAAAAVEIQENEVRKLRKQADRSVFNAKNMLKGAAALKHEDEVKKMGNPEEAQDAISAAKNSARVATAALEAVDKAITVNKMTKLSSQAADQATASALQAVEDNSASKLAAAAAVAGAENGAAAIQAQAAEQASEAAQRSVAAAAREQADKDTVTTSSANAMANAERAALKAKIALENVDRAAKGEALEVVPARSPLPISTNHSASPQQIVAAEKQAGNAAKDLLVTTMDEIHVFGKKTKAAAKLVSEATDAASNLRDARANYQRAKQELLNARLYKTQLYEQLQQLNDERDHVEKSLKKVKLRVQVSAENQNMKQLVKDTDADEQSDMDEIFKGQHHILKLDSQIRERRVALAKARSKEVEIETKVEDLNTVWKSAEAVETKVSQLAKPRNMQQDVSTRELVEAKRAEMRYDIDKTAAKVAMQDAADSAHSAKTAVGKAKLDPESRHLVEASKIAVMSARHTAQMAHAAIEKVRAAAAADKRMERIADKVKMNLQKNAAALAATNLAGDKVHQANLNTQAAAQHEKEETERATAAMSAAELAMQRAGVNPSMQAAKESIQQALKDAQVANENAKVAARQREATEKKAESEREKAKMLVKKAKIIAQSAQHELERAQDATRMHANAKQEATDAEKAVQQAEHDIDQAEHKAVSSADEIERLSLKKSYTTGSRLQRTATNDTIGNSTGLNATGRDAPSGQHSDAGQHSSAESTIDAALQGNITVSGRDAEREKDADDIINAELTRSAVLITPEETTAAKTATAHNAIVQEAATLAMKAAGDLHSAQKLESLQSQKASQSSLLLMAKKKLNRVAREKVEDAKAAVRAATNEKAEKKRNLKTWWSTQSKVVSPSDTFVAAVQNVSETHKENLLSTDSKTDLDGAYTNKAIAIETESRDYMNDAKSDLEIALAKEMMSAKEVTTQRISELEEKNLVKASREKVKSLQRENNMAEQRFQAKSASLMEHARKAVQKVAPATEQDQAAAANEAEHQGIEAITKLVKNSVNQKEAQKAVKTAAAIRKKLRFAFGSLRAASDGKERAEKHEQMHPSRDANVRVRSWTEAYNERHQKFELLNTNLEKENWEIQMSTARTKNLLVGDLPASQAASENPEQALKLEALLSDIATADAVKSKEDAKLTVLKQELALVMKQENTAALLVSQSSGAAKYAAKLKEYVATQKRKMAAARVEGQEAKVSDAVKHRNKLQVQQTAENIDVPRISKDDLAKADKALQASVFATKEAKKSQDAAVADAKHHEGEAQHQIHKTIDLWKKVQNLAAKGSENVNDDAIRDMTHL